MNTRSQANEATSLKSTTVSGPLRTCSARVRDTELDGIVNQQ
jgi:hypothetical protein